MLLNVHTLVRVFSEIRELQTTFFSEWSHIVSFRIIIRTLLSDNYQCCIFPLNGKLLLFFGIIFFHRHLFRFPFFYWFTPHFPLTCTNSRIICTVNLLFLHNSAIRLHTSILITCIEQKTPPRLKAKRKDLFYRFPCQVYDGDCIVLLKEKQHTGTVYFKC